MRWIILKGAECKRGCITIKKVVEKNIFGRIRHRTTVEIESPIKYEMPFMAQQKQAKGRYK